MPGAATTRLAARLLLPDYIVRQQDTEVSCPLWLDGELVAPDSGTCTVTDAAGATISGGDVVVTNGVATYTVPAANVPAALTFTTGWSVTWVLVVDGVTHTFRSKAYLVRSPLHPVVTDSDLWRRLPEINPSNADSITARTDFADFRDEAWVVLINRISQQGSLPHLIAEPTALREPHLLLTLSFIMESFATQNEPRYIEAAAMYRDRYETEFSRLQFSYDEDQDGNIDSEERRAGTSSIWLGASPSRRRWGGW